VKIIARTEILLGVLYNKIAVITPGGVPTAEE
jgi:hypothetical protein